MLRHVAIILILILLPLCGHNVFIVVHGTWGLEKTWYMPGGDFFDELEKSAKKNNAVVVPFSWTGKTTNQAREVAAHNLAKLIDSYDPQTSITVIGHSHGGNVALLASHRLEKNKIFCFYTLGTPINPLWYPNMDAIEYCYNFFSFEDFVQPFLGVFEREFLPHERVTNIRITVNGIQPDHSGLHDPVVGEWLPYVHDIVRESSVDKTKPSMLHFTHLYIPMHVLDSQRQDLLNQDRQISLQMLHSLRKYSTKRWFEKN